MKKRIAYKEFNTFEDMQCTYDLMCLVLTFLGYKHHGNGIESGFKKGKIEYWVYDHGDIEVTEHESL